jgi:membrane protein implicated in regulation of membrane protease activity
MSDALVWWTLAGSAVVVELLTGTFYLLMLALGLAAAAVAAHLGASTPLQFAIAGLAGAGAVAGWHFIRSRRTSSHDNAQTSPDVNMDIGQSIHVADVSQWQPDGSITLHYRGAEWQGRLAVGATPAAGFYVIESVIGNQLVLRNQTTTKE